MTYLNKHDRADDMARAEAPYHDELDDHAVTLRALREAEAKVHHLEAALDGPSPIVGPYVKAKAQVLQLKAQRDALLTVCEAVEWVGAIGDPDIHFCPCCYNERSDGHEQSCKLAAAILAEQEE